MPLAAALFTTVLLAPPILRAEEPPPPATIETLAQEIRALRQEIADLRAQTAAERAAAASDARMTEMERRLEVLAGEVEQLRVGEAVTADQSSNSLGPAASKVYRTESGLSIGGYGELIYQKGSEAEVEESEESSLRSEVDKGTDRQFDLRRAVVYFGYKWSDKLLFNSEVELEHAGEEVSVEFAYLDYLWRPTMNLRAGLLLMPMGFLNELHEPTVFLGAERPATERMLIPSTWKENGVGLFGDLGPLRYRTYLVDGLNAAGFSEVGLRGGRQGGSEAKAEHLAWTGRLDYVGRQGLLLGGSAYSGRSGQGLRGATGKRLGVDTAIIEGHFEWRWRGLELRALAAQATLSDVAALNAALGLEGDAGLGTRLRGHYLQVGYDLLARRGQERALIPFVRWESLNTQDRVALGFVADPRNDVDTLTLGLSFKPIEQVVFKADYERRNPDQAESSSGFRLLLGYVF